MSLPLIARNTIYQFIGRGFSTLFGLLALAAITRYLGPEKYGWYTTVFTFLQFFAILADFGLTLISAQLIAEPGADEEKITSNLFSLRLLISTFFFGGAMLLIWFFPYPLLIKEGVLVVTGSLFAVTLQNIFMGLFQKHLRMDKVAIGDAYGRLVILIGYFLCIWFKWGLLPILLISVLANVSQFFLLLRYSRAFVKIRLVCDWPLYREIFKRSWPIAISIAFNLIYLKADTIILSLVRSQTEVGIYGAAYRVIDVAATIPVMFMGIMLPHLTAAWRTDKEKFKHYFRRAFDFMGLAGLPFVIGGIYLAGPLMTFVAGAEFAVSGQYLRVLLVALLTIFFGALSGHVIVALNRQRVMIWGYIIDAILSLIGYLIFIPRYGAMGAAWVTVFSEALILVLTFIVVERDIRAWPNFAIFGKCLLGCALMILAIHFIPTPHFVLTLLLGVLVYSLVMLLTRGVTKEMVREVMRGK